MVVVLNSFISKRPFFARKKVTFANLSQLHRRALFLAKVRKAQLSSTSVAREMRFRNSSCKVATFQYQASFLTIAALRKYLPLQSKPALSHGLSRIFREKSPPRFRA